MGDILKWCVVAESVSAETIPVVSYMRLPRLRLAMTEKEAMTRKETMIIAAIGQQPDLSWNEEGLPLDDSKQETVSVPGIVPLSSTSY